MNINQYTHISLVDYDIEEFANPLVKRMPPYASKAVAKYFLDNLWEPINVFKNTSEHFAVTCTLGYTMSIQQVKLLVIALKALEMTGDDFSKMRNMTTRIIDYEEGNSYFCLALQSGKRVQITFM